MTTYYLHRIFLSLVVTTYVRNDSFDRDFKSYQLPFIIGDDKQTIEIDPTTDTKNIYKHENTHKKHYMSFIHTRFNSIIDNSHTIISMICSYENALVFHVVETY